MMKRVSDVGSASGSPMGRSNTLKPTDGKIIFDMAPLRWVDGDYDEGGAYWGGSKSENIYHAKSMTDKHNGEVFVRATSSNEAKKKIQKDFPNCTFSETLNLEDMLSGYIEAALWSSLDESDNPLDESDLDVHEDSMSTLRNDCSQFIDKNRELIDKACNEYDYSYNQAGHDFWLTRNGHGVGFLDRDIGDYAQQLQNGTKGFGEIYLYIGDDGIIHSDHEMKEQSLSLK